MNSEPNNVMFMLLACLPAVGALASCVYMLCRMRQSVWDARYRDAEESLRDDLESMADRAAGS